MEFKMEEIDRGYQIIFGHKPVLLVAGHNFGQLREGAIKEADMGTGELVRKMCEKYDCFGIVSTRIIQDHNWNEGSEFRQEIRELIKSENIEVILDFHGSRLDRSNLIKIYRNSLFKEKFNNNLKIAWGEFSADRQITLCEEFDQKVAGAELEIREDGRVKTIDLENYLRAMGIIEELIENVIWVIERPKIVTNLYAINAIKEYFTRFVKIRSVDTNGNEVELRLTRPGGNKNDYFEYCDKVRIGENLGDAIKRSLKDDFDLEAVTSSYSFNDEEKVKNRLGEELQRVMIDVVVNYREMKDHPAVGLMANWVITNKFAEQNQEALEWLQKATTSDLACNRFETKEDAVEFVKKLYEAGAVKIWAEDIQRDENGEYTDSLRVILPADMNSRDEILEIYKNEMKNDYMDEPGDEGEGQTNILFWWD